MNSKTRQREAEIREFVDRVAGKFRTEKIVLFGSYARENPTEDSDADIFIIMDVKDRLKQGVKIRKAIARNFPLDLLIMSPGQVKTRLEMGDPFIKNILMKGKVLYESNNRRVAG